MPTALSPIHRTRLVLAGAGLVQGLAYYLAHEFWPDTAAPRAVAAALVFFFSVATITVHLAWTGDHLKRLAALAAPLASVFALLAIWVWHQIPVGEAAYRFDDARMPSLIVGTVIAVYVLLPFIQVYQQTGRREYPYTRLFHHGWNNFYIVAIGALFTGAFWLIILLWSELFKLIDLTMFEDVFMSAPFVSMSLTTVFGYGIALGRERERITNTLRSITLAIFRTLMPLLAVIVVLFLVSLPFTGLQPLWDTGHASGVLLALVALTILFLNGVYQDGTGDPPYDRRVRLGIQVALLGVPLLILITFYALGLRIGQYGLTPERFFAVLVAIVGALYSVGYAVAAVRRTDEWMGTLRRVNMALAWVIAALVVLVHTPLLDPLAWSARNQFNRLAGAHVSAAEFDYGFLRYRLGHIGWETLAKLEQLRDHPEAAAIRERVAAARAADSYRELQRRPTVLLTAGDLDYVGSDEPPPADLIAFLATDITREQTNDCIENEDCVLFAASIDTDDQAEYVLMLSGENEYQMFAYDRDSTGVWGRAGRLVRIGPDRDLPDRGALLDSVRATGARPQDVPYRDLQIGDVRLRLRPE